MSLLNKIINQVVRSQSEHHGVMPKKLRLPQAVLEQIRDDAKDLIDEHNRNAKFDTLMGIPVEADETMPVCLIEYA